MPKRLAHSSQTSVSNHISWDPTGTETSWLQPWEVPQSVMILGFILFAGDGSGVFVTTQVNTAIYWVVLEHLMVPTPDYLYGVAN